MAPGARERTRVNTVEKKTLSVIEVISIDIGAGAGISRYLESLNRALLSQEKIRIHIVYPVQGEHIVNEENVGKGVIIHHRLRVQPSSLSSPFSLLNKIQQIAKAIAVIARKEHVHVIHTHTPFAPVWIIASWRASRRVGIPCVATAHNVLLSRPALSVLTYCIVNVLIARGLYLTGVCEETLRGILGAKPAIGSGIDTTFFDPQNVSEEDIREFKSLYGLSDCPLIFYPARILKNKGQMDLLRVAKKLFDDGVQIQILLMGDEQDKKYADCLHAEILRLKLQDRVKILPHDSPNKVCIGYAASSIVVFPSYDEALGLIALEAAAMERPVVAYNAGGLREAVIHGKNGYIARKGDVDAMCQYVKKLLQNDCLRSNMGKNGREFVKNLYDSMILADRHLKLYRELAGKNQA
jgi:glycosyltransferase involved in cell wall biosynthesis